MTCPGGNGAGNGHTEDKGTYHKVGGLGGTLPQVDSLGVYSLIFTGSGDNAKPGVPGAAGGNSIVKGNDMVSMTINAGKYTKIYAQGIHYYETLRGPHGKGGSHGGAVHSESGAGGAGSAFYNGGTDAGAN